MRRWIAIPTTAAMMISLVAASGAARSQQDWNGVQAWEGTVTMLQDKDINETSTMGTRIVTTGHVTTSAKGRVKFNDLYDDGQVLSWVGANVTPGLTVHVDHNLTATTYQGDRVVSVENTTAKGSGTAGIVEEDADVFEIDPQTRVYGFTIEPSMFQVDCTHKLTSGGKSALIDKTGKCELDDGYGVTFGLTDLPLPSSGMHLTGTRTLGDGTTITWDLSPAK